MFQIFRTFKARKELTTYTMKANNEALNVLIIDDEKKACLNLKNILLEFIDPNINILGFAHNTTQAEQKIKELKPHAVFLDIEMPNENAFLFLERIAPVNFDVIFVTAYDEYAVKAFRFNAIDYILKPISIQELSTAVEKLKDKAKFKKISTERISFDELSNQIANKVKQHKITLKDNNRIEIIDIKNLYYIEALGSYSKIVFIKDQETNEMTLSAPLSDYEELLPAEIFYRIHRSYLVNCTQIKKIENNENLQVILRNKISIPVSRRRYTSLLKFLKNNDFPYE